MANVLDTPMHSSLQADHGRHTAHLVGMVPATDIYEDDLGRNRIAQHAFPAAALDTPMFEGKDLAGLIGAIIITLGPLAAYSFGWGA